MDAEQLADPRQTLDVKRAYAAWLASPMAAEIAELQARGLPTPGYDERSCGGDREPAGGAPHGFLLLGRSFTLRCADPECAEDHPFAGLHWRPTYRTLPANEYADAQHDDGLLLHWFGLASNKEERQFFGSNIVPVGTGTFVPSGRPLLTSYSVEIGAMSVITAQLCRYARAMWTLMQQPLAAVGEMTPDRAQRRRLQKDNQPPGPVVVITLRRRSALTPDQHDDGAQVEWSHRWMVRGHWRNHWHPRLDMHRPIWISEYIKGPDDKPLVLKDKIIAWRR